MSRAHIADFRAAIEAAGLVPPEHIDDDGKRHRFSSSGRRGDDSGWYVLYGDERPAGAFGCWRAQISETWKSSQPQPERTPAERQAWKERLSLLAAEREAEAVRLREDARQRAAAMWARAIPAWDHEYLVRKGVGSKAAADSARMLDGELLVPMKHGRNELVGLQRIGADGVKRYLYGTPKVGAYTTIGKHSNLAPIVIVEGYATGLSVHLATGWFTVVAFDCGNLEPVARKIRAALPAATLILGADDDAFTEGNPGRTAAADAAQAVGARVCLPQWIQERGRGTDFNDLMSTEGLEAVRYCFGEPEEAPDNEPTQPPASTRRAQSASGAENPDSNGTAAISHAGAVAVAQEAAPPVPVPNGGHGALVASPATLVPDYVAWLPNTNDKGKPLATIENVDEIAQRLGVTVRYNVISKDEEILIPGQGFSLDNRQNASFAWLTSECAKFRFPVDRLGDFVTYLAERNPYNPVANWIDSRPWDGVDRLTQLIGTVHAEGEAARPAVTAMKRAFITRWMVSAVAAAFRPNGVSAHGVLVFQGDQYIGKTKWFKTLVPAELGVLQDGVILRPEDRDSVKQCVSNWLVELGELDATFRKSDIAALKAFLTKDRDVLRRAYARKESEFARRTVFFASVNPTEFLHDPTGNRRYWTIACEKLDHDHGIDMQQCWAQVAHLWRGGESWFLSAQEMDNLNAHNKAFEVVDPIEELIGTGLDWNTKNTGDWLWMPASDVLRALGRDAPTQSEATRAAHVIRERNGKNSKKVSGVRKLLVPPVIRSDRRHQCPSSDPDVSP